MGVSSKGFVLSLIVCFLVSTLCLGVVFGSSDNWVEVTRFVGTKGFTTNPFVCNHSEWRIRWEFDPGHWHFPDLHTFQVTTYKQEEPTNYINQIRQPPGANLNGVELLNQSGTFYLEIGSGLIDSYTIIIEENIESIPEFPSIIILSVFLIASLTVVGFRKNLTKHAT